MLGSIIGDIVGSTFEVENHRSKFFDLFRNDCRFTDDTILVVSVSDILLNWEKVSKDNKQEYIYTKLRSWSIPYLNRGFGSLFNQWIISGKNQPYKSYGNNSLARISPLIIYSKNKKLSLEKTLEIGREITEATHNTTEATNAVSCYLEIAYRIIYEDVKNFKEIIIGTLKKYDLYDLKSLEELRVSLDYDVTARTTLLVVASALLNSNDFEDCLRNIVSVGGDTDTYCSVGGALAEIIWGIDPDFILKMEIYFKKQDKELLKIVNNIYGLA